MSVLKTRLSEHESTILKPLNLNYGIDGNMMLSISIGIKDIRSIKSKISKERTFLINEYLKMQQTNQGVPMSLFI